MHLGLRLCTERGLSITSVELDSLLIVNCFNDQRDPPWTIEYILRDCKNLIPPNASISHATGKAMGLQIDWQPMATLVKALLFLTGILCLPRALLHTRLTSRVSLSIDLPSLPSLLVSFCCYGLSVLQVIYLFCMLVLLFAYVFTSVSEGFIFSKGKTYALPYTVVKSSTSGEYSVHMGKSYALPTVFGLPSLRDESIFCRGKFYTLPHPPLPRSRYLSPGRFIYKMFLSSASD
ncbi:hypothetical protein CFOL_v3_14894 [Cephalotus follicularis]|uniref:Uncharacterized protein n=1 Tax=Cephalotus follicularis TaxID=3775 RepID=A0A1Q3BTW5_CEPFO|nr:hypothetical protein CFOL_v3_14894 [Cephalotus follicularis]